MSAQGSDQAQVFTGTGIQVYQAKVIAKALRVYATTGRQVNRSYTPAAMIDMARRITGNHSLKPRGYLAAAEALDKWVSEQ